jgi:hypothetical protein
MATDSIKPKKRVLVSYGVDIDAIAGWLGSYKGEDSTSDVSRGTADLFNGKHIPVLRLAQVIWPARLAYADCSSCLRSTTSRLLGSYLATV